MHDSNAPAFVQNYFPRWFWKISFFGSCLWVSVRIRLFLDLCFYRLLYVGLLYVTLLFLRIFFQGLVSAWGLFGTTITSLSRNPAPVFVSTAWTPDKTVSVHIRKITHNRIVIGVANLFCQILPKTAWKWRKLDREERSSKILLYIDPPLK